MKLQDIKRELGEDWDNYKKSLKSGLNSENPLLQIINLYLFKNGGKELRPVLCLLAARSCGIPNKISWDCAAVSEIIHTATLLHDDVVDNSDLRRGVQTVKSKFSASASVLTGDFWLSRALYIISSYNRLILSYFTLALEELSEGELFQMQKADALDISEEDYYQIIHKKTASLFIATLKSAVFSVGGSEEEISLIKDYAYELGVAFQIRDDIFDYSPSMNTGKPCGEDIKERKITLPLIGAFNNSGSNERERIINKLLSVSDEKEAEMNMLVSDIFEFVREHKGIEYAQKKLQEHSSRAVEIISKLEAIQHGKGTVSNIQKSAINNLKLLAEYVGNRKS